MNILLLGEFSALHKNLKEGLQRLDHNAVVASGGDSWKQIQTDLNWSSPYRGLIGYLDKAKRIAQIMRSLEGYDVVQLISPVIFPRQFGVNKRLIENLMGRNGKVFLVGAGSTDTNSVIADFQQNKYKYPQFYEEIVKAYGSLWSQTESGRRYNSFLLNKIDGYIPISYLYAEGYRDIGYEKLCPTIPIPINVKDIEYQDTTVGQKVIFFHGLNRDGIKGTPLISQAMENIKKKYPNDVEVIIDGRMPLTKYMKLLRRVHVVIDQVYSLSYGMNAIYSMAMGKTVVGGGKLECLQEFGVESCPVKPIEPSVTDIQKVLEEILDSKKNLSELGLKSRQYVEKVHDCEKIAQKYIDTWGSNNFYKAGS